MKGGKQKSGGMVMIEMLVTVPVLLIMFLGSVEFGRVMRTYQMMSFLSRDSSSAAFRDCAFVDEAIDPLAIDTCLQDQYAQKMSGFINANLPNTSMILSVYSYNPVTTMIERIGEYPAGAAYGGGHSSQFQPDLLGSFPLTAVNNTNRVIAISEVFHDYTPNGKSYLGLFSGSPVFYEVTIF